MNMSSVCLNYNHNIHGMVNVSISWFLNNIYQFYYGLLVLWIGKQYKRIILLHLITRQCLTVIIIIIIISE